MNLRPATLMDADLLYQWRVEGEQADWYEGPPTSREEHDAWLEQRIDNPCVRIWIVEGNAGEPLGVVRLDSNDELSVEIAPEYRGLGLGTAAIEAACDQAQGRVKACVDQTNHAARNAFLNAGFEDRADVIFYLWRPANRCPATSTEGARCIYDRGHDGDHFAKDAFSYYTWPS